MAKKKVSSIARWCEQREPLLRMMDREFRFRTTGESTRKRQGKLNSCDNGSSGRGDWAASPHCCPRLMDDVVMDCRGARGWEPDQVIRHRRTAGNAPGCQRAVNPGSVVSWAPRAVGLGVSTTNCNPSWPPQPLPSHAFHGHPTTRCRVPLLPIDPTASSHCYLP